MQKITFRDIRFRLLIALVCIALLGQGIVLQPALAKQADAPNKLYTSFLANGVGPYQTLTAVSWSNPKVTFVFAIANDLSVRERALDGNTLTWGSWTNLGTVPVAGRYFNIIKAVAWQGRVDLFAMDNARDIWHRVYSPYGGWQAWENLGGGSTYFDFGRDIQVVSWAPGRIDVFSNYPWDVTYHKWYGGGAWGPSGSAWEKLNFRAGSVVSWGPNRIDTLGGNSAGIFYHHYTNGDGLWWPSGVGEDMNYTSYADPLLLSTGSNRLDIFAIPTNPPYNTVYKAWTGSNWTGWTSLGDGVPGQCPWVTGVSWGPDRFDIFEVRGGSAPGVYHKGHQSNVWYPSLTGWEYVGGEAALNKVEVTSWGPNRLDIFAIRSNDGSMWHLAWGDSGWWPGVNSWELVNP
ncbi:MAG: hypothetical protein WA821_21645 [Anaerolineales bacterium]